MEMTTYQWVTLGLGAVGFLITWTGMWFGAGRFIEQIRAEFKKHIGDERDKIIAELKKLEDEFEESQRAQDHNFGEVGHAMREHIAKVEKQIREVEIWGRDNYVKKDEFEKATDRLTDAIKSVAVDIKSDIRERIDDLRDRIEQKTTQQ
jgi:predicted ribosome quality control (RQC) complex YloA/Tae2 family protein